MSTHKKFPKVSGFHNVYKSMQLRGELSADSAWYAKIKLHGTNAGIRFSPDGTITAQKRTDDVSVGDDNAGFAAFVEEKREFLEDWYKVYRNVHSDCNWDVIIYGEWAGPGVQKGVATSDIPEKCFFIFSVTTVFPEQELRSVMVFNSTFISHLLGEPHLTWNDNRMYVIPEFGVYHVDTRFREGAQTFVDEINDEVQKIEDCDPYMKELFGVEGTGEGLVFYPLGRDGKDCWCYVHEFDDFSFKVKGEKHAVNKAGKPARVKSAVPESAFVFADQHVTDARLEQGLQEFGGTLRMEDTGRFIGWVCKDVAEESAQEIEESGLAWKGQLSGVVANRAREFFIRRVEAI